MQMITKAWWPESDDEFAIFLEDDIEVSPHHFEFILLLLNRHIFNRPENESKLDRNLIGISLYTPRWDEINYPPKFWIPSQRLSGSALFLAQVPCSWGALYFPWSWRRFIRYYNWRTGGSKDSLSFVNTVIVPGSRSNSWTRSWKK